MEPAKSQHHSYMHCIIFLNFYSAAHSRDHSEALPVRRSREYKQVLRRDRDAERDPDSKVKQREDGRAFQRDSVQILSLKKPGLDPDNVSNCWAMLNLTFLSNFIEKVVIRQMVCYIESVDLILQPGFKEEHCMDTVLLRLISDIRNAIYSG